MTFTQIKCAVLSFMLGAVIATSGYLLSTASYVGSSTIMILEPKKTDSGTLWLAADDNVEIEVRYISSLIEKPAITIRKKQQWIKLAICMSAGMLLAYISWVILMRKARAQAPQPQISSTPVITETNPITETTSSENTRNDPL
jgi:hypothetical protein